MIDTMYEVANSSNVTKVGWDGTEFQVEFKGGSNYVYEGVDERDALVIIRTAEMPDISTGHLINRLIKSANYKFRRVEAPNGLASNKKG